jgi:hypothetical protein
METAPAAVVLSRWDRAGMLVSGARAVHCTLLPLLIASVPVLGLGRLLDERLEWAFIVTTAIVGAIAHVRAYWRATIVTSRPGSSLAPPSRSCCARGSCSSRIHSVRTRWEWAVRSRRHRIGRICACAGAAPNAPPNADARDRLTFNGAASFDRDMTTRSR